MLLAALTLAWASRWPSPGWPWASSPRPAGDGSGSAEGAAPVQWWPTRDEAREGYRERLRAMLLGIGPLCHHASQEVSIWHGKLGPGSPERATGQGGQA